MGGYVDKFKNAFSNILADIEDSLPDIDIMYSVADYRDYTDGGNYQTYGVNLIQPFTSNTGDVQAAIDELSLGCGGDGPESQLKAMVSTADNWLTLDGPLGFHGRTDARKIIIWAGDIYGHIAGDEPNSSGPPPSGYYPTLDATINALTDRDIMVFALNIHDCNSGINAPYGGVYVPHEPLRQQADEITSATGGILFCSVGTGEDAIVDAITGICHLRLTKVDDITGCVGPGDKMTYTISYNYRGDSNCCTEDINDVNILDYLPAEVEFLSASDDGSYDSDSHTVIWDLGVIHLGGAGFVTVTVRVENPQPGSTITNPCEIRSGGEILDTAYEDTYVCPCPTLTKDDNITGCVGPGDSITYTICYDPNGRDDTNLVITDTLPEGVDFNWASGDGEYDPGSRMVTWHIGQIDPNDPNGGCVTLKVDVNCVEPNSIITNECETKSGDKILCTAYEYTSVCPGPTLKKDDNVPDDGYASPGFIITYKICYDANGYGGTDVNFVDTLPTEVNYLSSDPCGYYDADSHTVTWYIGTLGPNCVTLHVIVKDDAPSGTITNCCEVTDYCIDINACESTQVVVRSSIAIKPDPRDRMRDVNLWPILKWTPGRYVQEVNEHQVYFGTNWADVNSATTSTEVIYRGEFDVNWYAPYADFGAPLSFNTTYYWRIDEVNDACDASPWKGDVWSFTTALCAVVEDFDSYADNAELWEVWKDWVENGTCAEVYLGVPPEPVLDGNSMKYLYRNYTYPPYYSEADATMTDLGPDPNWLGMGAKALTLWFYGQAGNDANEQMYVKLTDNAARTATVAYDGNPNDVQEAEWHEWNIALEEFIDNNLSFDLRKVAKITIGFGDGTQAESDGTMYFDDIEVCASRCVLAKRSADFALTDYAPAGNPAGDCVIDYLELEMMVGDWLMASPPTDPNVDVYDDGMIDFKDFAILAEMWLEEELWP